jgi:hypothetical protein
MEYEENIAERAVRTSKASIFGAISAFWGWIMTIASVMILYHRSLFSPSVRVGWGQSTRTETDPLSVALLITLAFTALSILDGLVFSLNGIIVTKKDALLQGRAAAWIGFWMTLILAACWLVLIGIFILA